MATADTDPDRLAEMMVGGKVDLSRIDSPTTQPGENVLEARGLIVRDKRTASVASTG